MEPYRNSYFSSYIPILRIFQLEETYNDHLVQLFSTYSFFVSHIPHGAPGPGTAQITSLPALVCIHCMELGNPQCFPRTLSVPGHTVWEIGVTELQILAGTCWVMLSAQWMLHLLNFQFQGIQRAKNFLHAICIVHVVVGISIVHQLAGVNVSPGPLGRLDGQWLDDFSRRTLICGERRSNFSLHWQWGRDRRVGQSSHQH